MDLVKTDKELDKVNTLVYFTLEKEGVGVCVLNLEQWHTGLKMVVAAALVETASKLTEHQTDFKTDNPTYN